MPIGRRVLPLELSHSMFQSAQRDGTRAMGKTRPRSNGKGTCNPRRRMMNPVRITGRTRVGTKAPARNARRYGWEFIASSFLFTGNRAAQGSTWGTRQGAARVHRPGPGQTMANGSEEPKRQLRPAAYAA